MQQQCALPMEIETFAVLAPTSYHRGQFYRWIETPKFREFFDREYPRIAKYTRNAQGSSRLDAFGELLAAHSLAAKDIDLTAYHPEPNGRGEKNPDFACAIQSIPFYVEAKHLNITSAQWDVYNLLTRLEEAVVQAGKPYSVNAAFYCGDQNELLPHEPQIRNFILEELDKAQSSGAAETSSSYITDKRRLAQIYLTKRDAPRFSCGAMPGGSMHGLNEIDKLIQAVGKAVLQSATGSCNVAAIVADSSAYSYRELEIALTTIYDRIRTHDDAYFAGLTFRGRFKNAAEFHQRLKCVVGYLYCDGIKWRVHPNWLSEGKSENQAVWKALSVLEDAYI